LIVVKELKFIVVTKKKRYPPLEGISHRITRCENKRGKKSCAFWFRRIL